MVEPRTNCNISVWLNYLWCNIMYAYFEPRTCNNLCLGLCEHTDAGSLLFFMLVCFGHFAESPLWWKMVVAET